MNCRNRWCFIAMAFTRVAPILVAAAVVSSSAALARRLPAPGHKATLALPVGTIAATRSAHLYTPLVERVRDTTGPSILAHPALPGTELWRSTVLATVQSGDGGSVWTLATRAPPSLVVTAVQRCLAPLKSGAVREWPSRVLKAARVKARVEQSGTDVVIRFTRPVGPLLELLAGCPLRGDDGAPTGAYFPTAPGILMSRAGAPLGPTPLGILEFTALGSPADLIGGSAVAAGGGMVLAPFPDVVVLLQSEVERERDGFGLKEGAGGVLAFRDELGADFLLSVYWSGRGGGVEGLLPPGVAPARPLPLPSRQGKPTPLTLATLGVDAPRVPLRFAIDDNLLVGVGDRLAVLLRSRGFLTDSRPSRGGPLISGVELLRWRPPTEDPAVALLELAGRNPELMSDEDGSGTLDPRLLSMDEGERLEGALAVERQWLEERRVIPLMTAERWFTFDPRLHGVHIRADGVPLLHDAFWGAAR